MMSLEDDIAEVQRVLQPMFAKPQLKDNLLQKPPFRFVHDVVSGVTKGTGFAHGLYDDRKDLTDSKAIKEKQAKLDYLERIILCVGNYHGRVCDVRANKVVAGLEPERTCSFFLDLAAAANACTPETSAAAVRRTLAGEQPDASAAAAAAGSDAKEEAGSKAAADAKEADAPGPVSEAQAKPPPSRGGGARTAAAKDDAAPRSGGA